MTTKSPGLFYDQIESMGNRFGGIDDGPDDLLSDQIENLACQLWQQKGRPAGHFQECRQEAKLQFLHCSTLCHR